MSGNVLVNGGEQDLVSVFDRGFQYGDGVFETMVVMGGRVRRLHAHLERMRKGCERLRIEPPDAASLLTDIRQLSAGKDRAVLKLIVTRGPGKRGYRFPPRQTPTRVLWIENMPEFPASFWESGVAVRFCDTRLGSNPALAGLKHLNRLENVLARAEWNDEAIVEGLMKDGNDAVIGGTTTNLFLVRNGVALTPRVDQCGVAGTTRAAILALAPQLGIAVRESTIGEDGVCQADEVFLTNAVIGIWPVCRLASREWPAGPITRQLQAALAAEPDLIALDGESSDNRSG